MPSVAAARAHAGAGEEHAAAVLDESEADGRGQVGRRATNWRPCQFSCRRRRHLRLGDDRDGIEVEPVEGLADRQAGLGEMAPFHQRTARATRHCHWYGSALLERPKLSKLYNSHTLGPSGECRSAMRSELSERSRLPVVTYDYRSSEDDEAFPYGDSVRGLISKGILVWRFGITKIVIGTDGAVRILRNVAIYALLVILGFIGGIFISDFNLFGPKDYEECEQSAAKTAKLQSAVPILIESCRNQFAGRRKPGGGYAYYDERQLRSFDIEGPNPTVQELTYIDEQYRQYAQAERQRQAAEAARLRQKEDLQAKLTAAAKRQNVSPLSQIASAQGTLYYYVTALDPNGANVLALRASPSFHAALSSTKIPPQTLLTKLGEQGEWINVALSGGEEGWVRARYLACCRRADSAPDTNVDARAWITLTGRDVFGGDYAEVKDGRQPACEERCRADTQCKAYSFDRWNQICYLKSSVGTVRLDPRIVSQVLASARLKDDSSASVMVPKRNKGFPDAGYRQSKTDNYDKCNSICLMDQDCSGFNYRQSDHICSLIQFPSEYQTVVGTDLGYKIQSP